jgi:multidrug efflux pump subunit AcrB
MAQVFIKSSLTPLMILFSLLLGLGATLLLPREEEPQITVPMADVFVSMPGASAKEIEQRVTFPMEKLVRELQGVEYVYSTSRPGSAMLIVRFLVGTPPEDALVRLYSKLYANFDKIPPGATQPLIKAHSIDDVPILALTFSSPSSSAFELRQVVAQLEEEVKQVDNVSETTLLGGQRRQMKVELDPFKLAAYHLSPAQVAAALAAENSSLQTGTLEKNDRVLLVRTGEFLRNSNELESTVVALSQGKPVYLREVAQLVDGPEEPSSLVFFGRKSSLEAAVTLAVAKRRGANAITVSEAVLSKLEMIKSRFLPHDVTMTVTRNYGETALERSNELLVHMGIAVLSVTALIFFSLGHRESVVVAIAIPVTLALTLATFVLYKFTLNRVTFFALIFSIGILVDDAIVVVENVVRHLRLPQNQGRSAQDVVLEAVAEVGNPTILATLAVVAAILPMAFVSGLMGPYMLPIPLGASAAMLISMVVAFTVVPWAALKLLKNAGAHHSGGESEDKLTHFYRWGMGLLLHRALYRWLFLVGIVLLLIGAASMMVFRGVIFKMLPFDNKSEFQVLVNMPEGTTLERTLAVTQALAQEIAKIKEVTNYQIYAGTSAPFNFNGLVRHYFLRSGPNLADIQVNLLPKAQRKRQSHDVAKTLRPTLTVLAKKFGATLQVAEIPPGPPVLQTLVSEVYGPKAEERLALAKKIKTLFEETEGVVDVDWYVEAPQDLLQLTVDREKASLSGVTAAQVSDAVDIALKGRQVGLLHVPQWREDIPVTLRFPPRYRDDWNSLKTLPLATDSGRQVVLGSLAQASLHTAELSIYHKNLQPVIYVLGDVAGKLDSPLYSILDLTLAVRKQLPDVDIFYIHQPENTQAPAIKWDGEWQVTYEVFRDMGIAFAVVMVLIYVLIVGWFQDLLTPLVILSAVPFSLVGIMPGHWLLHSFFTATSMIGFIAGAGIVVRNSIILVDFIELRLREGRPLDEAVIDAGAVRFRPMLLTASAVVAGSAVMLADPIFNGLAISLMFGEVASLMLSRTAVPVLYFMLWSWRKR